MIAVYVFFCVGMALTPCRARMSMPSVRRMYAQVYWNIHTDSLLHDTLSSVTLSYSTAENESQSNEKTRK